MHRSFLLVRTAMAVAAVGTVAVSGCGDDDGDAPTLAELAGRTFESTDVEGHEMVAGTNVTMTFDEDGVAVMAGCNTLRGGAAITEGALQIGVMAQTMMACTDDLAAQDTFLVDFFTSGPGITLDGDTLTVSGAEASIVADAVED